MSAAQYDIKVVLIKRGVASLVQAAGKYVKIIRVSPEPNQITIQTDTGTKFNMLPGMGIPATFKTLLLTCANPNRDITVILYVGDIPVVDVATVQPASTLLTVDWITMTASSAVAILGSLIVEGTTYRRKAADLVNMNGLAGMTASALALVNSNFTARNSLTQLAGTAYAFNGPERPLMPSTGVLLFPLTIETDDTINVSAPIGSAIDLSIVQTWLPVIS